MNFRAGAQQVRPTRGYVEPSWGPWCRSSGINESDCICSDAGTLGVGLSLPEKSSLVKDSRVNYSRSAISGWRVLCRQDES